MEKSAVLVTGGTGLLGRPLVARLSAEGVPVIAMSRRPPGPAGAEAPEGELHEMQDGPCWVKGDVTLPRLGLSERAYEALASRTLRVIHLAARTDFTSSDEAYGAQNVEGTRKVLEFTHAAGAALHHVSTAFVCGERRGRFAEADLDVGQGFRNGYEKSKLAAERMVREEAAKRGVPMAVYRPGILLEAEPLGERHDRIGPLFYVETLARLLARRKPDRPIRVKGNADAGLPLVMDHDCAEVLARLTAMPEAIGRTFHLVPSEPVPNRLLAECANAAFGRKVVEWTTEEEWQRTPASVEEQLVERKAAVYARYLSLDVSFDRGSLETLLGRDALPTPTIQEVEASFVVCLEARARVRGERAMAEEADVASVRAYFEEYLPRFQGRRLLKNLETFSATFWIQTSPRQAWTVVIQEGVLSRVEADRRGGTFGYEVTPSAFLRVARGEIAPQESFFQGQVTLLGEKVPALRTATVLEEFFRKYPYEGGASRETAKGALIALDEVQERPWKEVVSLARRHLNPGLVDLMEMGEFTSVEPVRARGAHLYDRDGRAILDMVSSYGALNLGHNHPRVADAVRTFLDDERLDLSKEMISRYAAALAHNLSCLTPGDLDSVYFCNSGAEAIEAALKLAQRYHQGRRAGFVYAQGSMHGKTIGALSVTGGQHFRDVFRLLPQVEVPYGDTQAIEQALARAPKQGEGAIAGVVLEPVQGEAGVIVPPRGYLAEVAEACRRHGALLILDEIQTGFGRTGSMFACEAEGVVPDILALAKSLGGGVATLAATVARREVYRKAYGNPHDCLIQTSTFGGRASACAAGIAAIEAIREGRLPERAARLGERLLGRLRELAQRHSDWIAEVRGRGLMIGIEFRADLVDRLKSLPLRLPGLRGVMRKHVPGMVSAALLKRHGILCSLMLNNRSVLRVYPPLVVEEAELDRFAEALSAVLDAGFEALAGERVKRVLSGAGLRFLVPWLGALSNR